MRLLFVCKANKFRSKVAEAIFNKYNKNKKIKVESAGISIEHVGEDPPLAVKILMKIKGFKLTKRKSRLISKELVENFNLVVNVADDVPENIFRDYKKKVVYWKIRDFRGNWFLLFSIVNKIEMQVKKLIKELNN